MAGDRSDFLCEVVMETTSGRKMVQTVVKVEESSVVPTCSPEPTDSLETRTGQKKFSKIPNLADATEKEFKTSGGISSLEGL